MQDGIIEFDFSKESLENDIEECIRTYKQIIEEMKEKVQIVIQQEKMLPC